MTKILEQFSKDYWENFITQNKGFSEACVLKDAMSPNLVNELNLGIMEVLKNRLSREDISDGFRVYIESKEQDDKYLLDLCKSPPNDGENIEEFAQRTFDKKFGIIINSGEKHSDRISENIIKSISPLIDIAGLPPLGVEITIFIGNYGWTPLGIHQDHRGENVIHFHLGPGNKSMYVWDEDVYKDLVGVKHNNTDIEPILPHAKEFTFGTGDLYYMPWNKHHVGYTGELSVGITLWFNNPSKFKYINKILESFRIQFIKKDPSILSNQFDMLESKECLNNLLETIDLESQVMSGSLKDFFDFSINEFNYCLLSNAGWQSVPLSKKETINFDSDTHYTQMEGKKIISKDAFKILYKKDNEKLTVYVRGSKFSMHYFESLITIIDEINKHIIIDVDNYIKSKELNMPTEAFYYFLALLYDKRGFEFID